MIFHDSRNANFRRPFGAAAVSTDVYLAAETNTPELTLRLRRYDGSETLHPMTRRENGRFDITITTPDKGVILWYSFLCGNEETAPRQLTVYEPAAVPAWWKEAVCYQIFPDRFAREADWTPRQPVKRKGTHRFLVEDWETPVFYPRGEDNSVTSWPFWGGTLRGIQEKLPYLQELGITALYLNPIFEAASNHRYDTADYTKIDPLLGTEEDFTALCAAAEERGIRIILDGVFNHTGADSIYFDLYGNYGTGDKYRHWFRFGNQYKHGYECWWDVPVHPNVEENDPSYRQFICGEEGVLRRWLKKGASGWRLDVADELPDSFIREIREAIKAENPDALLMGEVWEDASNKVSYNQLREYFLGHELDSTMHYPFREALLDFLRWRCNAYTAAEKLWAIRENYPWENQLACLNLIGSHDRERALTLLDKDENRLKQIALLQYALPGVPCIYYGDEAGMTGAADPYNRGSFPWGLETGTMKEHYRMLSDFYHSHSALRTGDCEILFHGEHILGCRRSDETGSVLALINRSDRDAECFGVTVPAHGWILQ